MQERFSDFSYITSTDYKASPLLLLNELNMY